MTTRIRLPGGRRTALKRLPGASVLFYVIVSLMCANPGGPGNGKPPPVPGAGVTLLSPNGGERFARGDTVIIKWKTDSAYFSDAMIWLLIDDGLREKALTTRYSIDREHSEWGNFLWIVPPDTTGLATDKARVWIHQYGDTELGDYSDDYFAIAAP